MNTEDQGAAEEYANNNGTAYALESSLVPAFLAGASHIRSTVVAPLEAKLAENEFLKETYSKQIDEMKQNTLSGEERIKRLLAQLSEAQRVIKDFREGLKEASYELWTISRATPIELDGAEWIQSLNAFHARRAYGAALEVLAAHPAPSEEKAE